MKLIKLIRLLFKYGIDQSQYMLANYDQIVWELIEKHERLWYESIEEEEISKM